MNKIWTVAAAAALLMTGACGPDGLGGDSDDNTAPIIVDRSPEPNAIDVALSTVVIVFDEKVSASTNTVRVVRVSDEAVVAGQLDTLEDTVVYTIDGDVDPATPHRVEVMGVTDIAGNPVVEESWTFTTL